ncbi:hypothetical protein H8K33_07540 [Undibacterium amnicola]|uniref:Uncharacterized protein n=1 Tax=Undibacterium amnicola TaxID=1834038 RepID=A0ABR6XPD0_9BURK|nr:hypothetical protein [Undibacterium amnicola]MBC3831357.1 hypothetical protein [Undibacterium amnicola]
MDKSEKLASLDMKMPRLGFLVRKTERGIFYFDENCWSVFLFVIFKFPEKISHR